MAHLSGFADDAGCAQISGGSDRCGFVYPDLRGDFDIIRSEGGAQGENELFDAFEGLPGISKAFQPFARQGMRKIKEVAGFIHSTPQFT